MSKHQPRDVSSWFMAKWRTKLEPWMVGVAVKLFAETRKSTAEVAAYLEVTRHTLDCWLAEGLQESCKDDELVDFAQKCNRARVEYLDGMRDVWRDHCLVDAKACLAEMKAALPDEYDRASRKEVSITNTTKHVLEDLRELSDEELKLQEEYERMVEARAQRKLLGK